ncbi:anthrax toxin lethal factor-related metalloendopeptidase [Clostridium senegalense]|uniref:ATLF-like domain-containing protein n=1 Tax=Clostridium senegalense TaxID=1465809 RepID=A0A6M0H5E0_9CLOT|nr:hypothetical protein [Clostridium senegalense]NEU05727.1 hypothetical protein [Clostridium senegalense]
MKKDGTLELFLMLLPFCSDVDITVGKNNKLKIKADLKWFYMKNILYKEYDVPCCVLKQYEEELSKIPLYLLQYYNYYEVKMYITKKSIRNIVKNEIGYDLGNMDIGGAFINLPQYLKGYVSTRYYGHHYVLLHELGHAIDAIEKFYGMGLEPSLSDVFKKIYKDERAKLFNKQGLAYVQTEKEYWAQCFALYNIDEEKLKKLAPRTHGYMKLILESIKLRMKNNTDKIAG